MAELACFDLEVAQFDSLIKIVMKMKQVQITKPSIVLKIGFVVP